MMGRSCLAEGPETWPFLPGVRNGFGAATAPLLTNARVRSRLSKSLQTCYTHYRAATAKERLRGGNTREPPVRLRTLLPVALPIGPTVSIGTRLLECAEVVR
jgi:hypothetical protein